MIEVSRNSLIIRDVDFESAEYKKFRYRFSIYDKGTFKYTTPVYTIIDNNIYMPNTAGYESIKDIFPKKEINFNYINTSKSSTVNYKMLHDPRDDMQEEAIRRLMRITKDDNNRHRLLALKTGAGKTYIMMNMISKINKKPMIIVDNLAVCDVWIKAYKKHTNVKDDEICILSGAESIKEAKSNKKYKVFIAIHRTLGNLLSEDYNALNLLMNNLKIGIKVFDEAHVEFKNICQINSLSNTEYCFFLTATFNRSNFLDNKLFKSVFNNIPYYDGKHLTDNKINSRHQTVFIYEFDSKPTDVDRASIKTKYGFNKAKWSNYILTDCEEIFADVIIDIVSKMKKFNRQMAIVLPTIDMMNVVKEVIDTSLSHLSSEIGMFMGATKKKDRDDVLASKIIITNDKIFDKSIDIDELEIVINFVPMSSLVKLEQLIGRLRYGEKKLNVMVDVTDIGFKEAINQQRTRKTFYRKKAKKIINLIKK